MFGRRNAPKSLQIFWENTPTCMFVSFSAKKTVVHCCATWDDPHAVSLGVVVFRKWAKSLPGSPHAGEALPQDHVVQTSLVVTVTHNAPKKNSVGTRLTDGPPRLDLHQMRLVDTPGHWSGRGVGASLVQGRSSNAPSTFAVRPRHSRCHGYCFVAARHPCRRPVLIWRRFDHRF